MDIHLIPLSTKTWKHKVQQILEISMNDCRTLFAQAVLGNNKLNYRNNEIEARLFVKVLGMKR
jgi:hypothetical protein